jgi:hypothetical protein
LRCGCGRKVRTDYWPTAHRTAPRPPIDRSR